MFLLICLNLNELLYWDLVAYFFRYPSDKQFECVLKMFLIGVDVHQPLVSEEKIVFGINAAAVSVMTLAKIRRVYSKADCRSIAKMVCSYFYVILIVHFAFFVCRITCF